MSLALGRADDVTPLRGNRERRAQGGRPHRRMGSARCFASYAALPGVCSGAAGAGCADYMHAYLAAL